MYLIRNCIFWLILFLFVRNFCAYTDLLKVLNYATVPDTNYVRVVSAASRKPIPCADILDVDILKSLSVELIVRADVNLTKPLQMTLMRSLQRDPGFLIVMYPTYIKVMIEIRGKKKAAYFHFHKEMNPYDKQWHKIVIKYCRGVVILFYDCKAVRTQNKIFEYMNFINASQVLVGFMTSNRLINKTELFVGFDVQRLHLYTGPERAYEENCRELPQSKKIPGLPGPSGLPGKNCDCKKAVY